MSVFPRRLAAGQPVTVHFRRFLEPGDRPGLASFTLQIFGPDGELVDHQERNLLTFLPVLAEPDQPGVRESFSYAPLLLNFTRVEDEVPSWHERERELFAQIAAGRKDESRESQFQRISAMLERLAADFCPPSGTRRLALEIAMMRASSHFYWHYTLPEDAQPGRYQIVVTGHGAMGLGDFPVVSRDELFVDRPELLALVDKGGGMRALIGNQADVVVPVRLAEPRSGGARTRRIDLAPRSCTEIEVDGPLGFLLFAEGTRALVLSFSDSPLVVRRAGLVVRETDAGSVLVALAESGASLSLFPALAEALEDGLRARLREGPVLLDGALSGIFRIADGLHQVDEIERECGPAALADAERLGLVHRIPLATVTGRPEESWP